MQIKTTIKAVIVDEVDMRLHPGKTEKQIIEEFNASYDEVPETLLQDGRAEITVTSEKVGD